VAESIVHSIADRVSKIVNPKEPTQEPSSPVQEAAPVPGDADDKTLQGLSRSLNKWRDQAVAAQAKLAEIEAGKSQPAPDRTPNDERESLTREITESVTEAEKTFDYRADNERLKKELAAKDTALRYKDDPVASRLLAAGVSPDSLSPDLLDDLRRVAAESFEMDTPSHNPINNRAGSQDESDARILKQLNSLF
jgi:hypothetical protein